MRNNVIGHIRKISEDVEVTRTIEFVASDSTRDAHGTVIPVDKWDLSRFNSNGVTGYQHNIYGDLCGNDDPDNVIGVGEARVDGEELIVRITFEPVDLNPLAEKIFRKLLIGTLKAVSVGFIPYAGHWGEGEESEQGTNPTYYYDSVELLEVSVVNIPSNKNALKRTFRGNTVDAIHFIYRALDGKYRYSDIEDMKVRDILNLLSGDMNDKKNLNPPDNEERDGMTSNDDDIMMANAVSAMVDDI